MMSDYAIDKQQEKWEAQDAKYQDEQRLKKVFNFHGKQIEALRISFEPEYLPKNWAKNIMNKIVWGPDGKSKYDK